MATVVAEEGWERLAGAVGLLHQAAIEVWRDADEQAPDSPLHSLGLGVYLAKAQACALLPEDYQIPDVEPEGSGLLRLLARADELIRPLPIRRPDLVGVSQLVVDLYDLIREARELGY
ncbi:MAG: hypothetical protein GEU93_14245 [Propionibacteriales bacterium]|nr:hypothetical protein [Propionibacteriales bacterium]